MITVGVEKKPNSTSYTTVVRTGLTSTVPLEVSAKSMYKYLNVFRVFVNLKMGYIETT